MVFLSGSVTNANPGPTLYALIETAALGIGWTLDDTVTIGGNTHKVLKSAAAGNTYALDWFLDINYPTTGITGGMRFAPFEGYTAASDVGLRGPFSSSSTTIDATTYSRYGATTSALETNWSNTASFTGLSATLATTTFNYWISITRDRIIMLTSTQPTVMWYSGFFTPSTAHASNAGAALFPLIMAGVLLDNTSVTNGTASNVALTRVPKLTSFANGWDFSCMLTSQSAVLGYFAGGQAGTAVSPLTGATVAVPIPVTSNRTSAPNSSSPLIANIGTLNGVGAGYVSSGAARGDNIVDTSGDTWYISNPTNSWALYMEGV